MSHLEELGESDSHGIAEPASEHGGAAGGEADEKATLPEPKVKLGDYVQWTQNGVDQFRMPLQVVNIYPDGKHVQVFDSPAGIPMSELTVVDAPNAGMTPETSVSSHTSYDPASVPLKTLNDYRVYQHGNRIQITADVDLDGIATLKDMLDDYASILRRLAGKKSD